MANIGKIVDEPIRHAAERLVSNIGLRGAADQIGIAPVTLKFALAGQPVSKLTRFHLQVWMEGLEAAREAAEEEDGGDE